VEFSDASLIDQWRRGLVRNEGISRDFMSFSRRRSEEVLQLFQIIAQSIFNYILV
jgi:hypothetical protein